MDEIATGDDLALDSNVSSLIHASNLSGSRRSGARAQATRLGGLGAIGAILSLVLAAPANAQVAVGASLASEYVYRGVPLGNATPVVGLDVSYDWGGGAYIGGSTVGGEAAGGDPRIIGYTEYLGYARKLATHFTWDVGVTDSHYVPYYDSRNSEANTEIYSGLRIKNFSYYAYYSPRYFSGGPSTVYAEITAAFPLAAKWRVFGHIGALTPLDQVARDSPYRREQYDARAGVAVAFKGGELQLAWTSLRPGINASAADAPNRDTLILGANFFF